MKYLGRRLLRAGLLLVGVSALCFLLTEMAPGSFFDEMRLNPQISPETISALRARYGLDQPLAVRYARWMAAVVRGDFGYSIAYNTPVAPLLWARAKNTLLLTATSTLLTWLLAVPLGVLTAASRGRWLDKVVAVGSSLLISIPEIVIAIALLALAVRSRVVPVGGMRSLAFQELSTWGQFQDVARHSAALDCCSGMFCRSQRIRPFRCSVFLSLPCSADRSWSKSSPAGRAWDHSSSMPRSHAICIWSSEE